MGKINHEKLSKKEKVSTYGYESDEIPSTGSSADRRRYLDENIERKNKKNSRNVSSSNPKVLKGKTLLSLDTNTNCKLYSPTESYQAGERIKHHVFGMGCVLSFCGETIEVQFRKSKKTLVHRQKKDQDANDDFRNSQFDQHLSETKSSRLKTLKIVKNKEIRLEKKTVNEKAFDLLDSLLNTSSEFELKNLVRQVLTYPDSSLKFKALTKIFKSYKDRIDILEELSLHERLPSCFSHKLAEVKTGRIRLHLAINQSTPYKVLIKIAEDETNTDILDKVATHVNFNDKLASVLLNNNSASVSFLSQYYQSSSWHIRSLVAKNRNTPFGILNNLSCDKISEVVREVAKNVKTDQEILKNLSHHPDVKVRREVASNPSTDKQTLANMINDPDYNVLLLISQNKNADFKLSEELRNKCTLHFEQQKKIIYVKQPEVNKDEERFISKIQRDKINNRSN